MRLLSISLILFSLFSCQTKQPAKKYRVSVDGTFDLPHWGHQNVLKNARKTASEFFNVPQDQIEVVVGVAGTPEELAPYKRPSVYTQEEKVRQLQGFRGADLVVRKPMATTKDYMEKYKIDLVVAGDDYDDAKKRDKWYSYPHSVGKFKTFKRTAGVSTSNLLRRSLKTITAVLNKSNLSEDERKTVKEYHRLVDTHF